MLKNIAALLSACICAGILLSSCSQSPNTTPVVIKPGDYEQSMIAGGRTRNYLLHIPPVYDGEQAMPLVIILHGGGGNAKSMIEITGMNEKSDEAGFIAVYPNGTGGISDEKILTWNCGFCCGYAANNNIDDVGFIRSLIDNLEGQLNIDTARIFVTGISNGGMMTYRLGCELADKIAAIAPVAGSMGDWAVVSENPVSVIIFHGTADQHVLYEGGVPLKSFDAGNRVDKPVSYAVDFWVNFNNCSTTPAKETSGNIIKDVYSGGRNGSEVVLYTIIGGKHAWPGGRAAWLGGDVATREISATDLMWEFFAAHPKR